MPWPARCHAAQTKPDMLLQPSGPHCLKCCCAPAATAAALTDLWVCARRIHAQLRRRHAEHGDSVSIFTLHVGPVWPHMDDNSLRLQGPGRLATHGAQTSMHSAWSTSLAVGLASTRGKWPSTQAGAFPVNQHAVLAELLLNIIIMLAGDLSSTAVSLPLSLVTHPPTHPLDNDRCMHACSAGQTLHTWSPCCIANAATPAAACRNELCFLELMPPAPPVLRALAARLWPHARTMMIAHVPP